MKIMTHRTTFALDETTVKRLKKLSAKCHMSQSEIIRRSVEAMEAEMKTALRNPLELLAEYHDQGGLDSYKAEQFLLEAAEARADYRGND
jgi:predicted transcriptional regulator